MAKSLIVVESPSKAKTIRRILGKDFEVRSSLGHVKDLPRDKLGVEVEKEFLPVYETIPGKEKVLRALKTAAKKVERVFLASDPDREGEAISWHIREELKESNSNIKRLEFHEITPPALKKSLESPRDIDLNLVKAQQARRVLDRLVGYLVSPLLWEKVKGGLSAGRVQTVALRLVCEREEEIRQFTPRHYWQIEVVLRSEKGEFSAFLVDEGDKPKEFSRKDSAEEVRDILQGEEFRVREISKEVKLKYPPPPLITSSLQQTSFSRFRISPALTMRIAQKLYEGVDIEGIREGLITYMRTDSFRVSPLARNQARKWIRENWGEEYVPEKPITFKARKTAQEAHEAIRPTRVERVPSSLKSYLSPQELKVYTLIWERFLASQMAPSQWEETRVRIEAGKFSLLARGDKRLFEGYEKVLGGKEEVIIPELEEGEKLELVEVRIHEKTTQPPPRYTEGSLVREMEDKGIGRPSTYATILKILKDRDYVRVVKGRLHPTPLGEKVLKILLACFPKLFEVEFTARMEEDLDRIEEGKEDYLPLMERFYSEFSRLLVEAKKNMKDIREEVEKEDSLPCPKCGSPLVMKKGRFGKFFACSAYPECSATFPFMRKTGLKCPECGRDIVERWGKKGKKYYACITFPECKFISFRYPDAGKDKRVS